MTTATAAAAPSASTSAASSKAATPAPTSAASASASGSARPTPLFTHTSQHTSYHYARLPPPNASISSPLDDSSAALLQAYYLSRLPLLAKAFGFHERVLATAMSYFKRFWLPQTGRSVAQSLRGAKGRSLQGGKGVKVIMLISLFLATKTHSTPISLAQFASRVTPSPPVSSSKAQEERQAAVAETSSSILENEFEVASVLGWRFRVTHAFEGVRGLALDLQRLTSKAGGVAQDVGNRTVDGIEGAGGALAPEFLDRLKVLLDIASQQLRLTPAEFLYTPSQLALGTWWSLTEEEGGGEDKSGAAASASASASTLTSEERANLLQLLQRWIDEKGSLLSTTTTPSSSSSRDTAPPLSLKDLAHQVATHVRQGAALQEELRSPACVERVKSIDLALRARAEELQRNGGVDEAAEREEAEEDEAEAEEEEDARGVGAVLDSSGGSGGGGDASRKKRKSAPGTEAEGAAGEQEEGGQPLADGGGSGGESTPAGGGGGAPKRIKVVRQAESGSH